MRLILCLVLMSCSVYVKSHSNQPKEDEENKVLKAYIEDQSSQRQFTSYLRKWIFGQPDEKKMTKITNTNTNTKIKYLPIYVPVPVYSNTKDPNEFYGAYQHNKKQEKEQLETLEQLLNKQSSLPYAHNQQYNLPYSGELLQLLKRHNYPFYLKPYSDQTTKPTESSPEHSYYNPLQSSSGYHYFYDDADSSASSEDAEDHTESDSVVINNPALKIGALGDGSQQVYSRKRKRLIRKKIN